MNKFHPISNIKKKDAIQICTNKKNNKTCNSKHWKQMEVTKINAFKFKSNIHWPRHSLEAEMIEDSVLSKSNLTCQPPPLVHKERIVYVKRSVPTLNLESCCNGSMSRQAAEQRARPRHWKWCASKRKSSWPDTGQLQNHINCMKGRLKLCLQIIEMWNIETRWNDQLWPSIVLFPHNDPTLLPFFGSLYHTFLIVHWTCCSVGEMHYIKCFLWLLEY